MYAHLRGTVSGLSAEAVVLDVHGVGYAVQASTRTLGGLVNGAEALLYTYLSVREDALVLFGFADRAEHALFVRLIGVSGVGPKLALSLLSTFGPDEVIAAIASNQPATLARASGVGKKMAEKIIVELKDKLGLLAASGAGVAVPVGGVAGDVLSALMNLGYVQKVAEQAVEQARKQAPDGPFETLLKTALAFASKA